ncbi:hypothetical protein C1T30_43195, partial [Bacillus sp. MBGLi97]
MAVASFASSSSAQQIPRSAPEFTARTASGQPLQLSQFRGKPFIVQFLLTDCPHCQDTVRVRERLQKESRSRGLHAIAVAFDRDAQR